ncbi:MAG: APC family permease [Candidatus Bathycorpusculaceae bacterium]
MSKATFVREATGLVREFGPMMALMMAMNNMIGAGVWGLSIRMPYTYPGSDPTLAFIIGLIPAFFFAISYAWLASCMPRAGGDYVFISRTTNPALGYVVTIGNFLGRWFSLGFVLYTDVTLWAIAFTMLGKGTGNAALTDFGSWLAAADPLIKIAGALILLFTVWLFLTIGGTAFKAYTAIIWFIPIIGAIACILLNYANPFNPTSFQSAWDSVWGTGSYNEIVSIAQNHNYSPTAPNFDATIRAVAGAALFAYSGFHNPAQWSGEIKNPKRNLLIGIIGGTLITAVIYITLANSAFYASGDFISMYNWAYYKGKADFVITPKIEPVLPMFGVLFTGGNVLLAFLIATAGAFSLYHVQPAALMMETRRVFSLAFDRLFPERFANVSERFHTPTWAILFMIVGGAIGIIISSPVLGPLRTLAGGINATFMYLLGYLFTGLALALLPITKPEIYESIKVEVGGVPVPAICGVAAFALGIFFFAANAQVMAPLDIFISCLVLGIGLALYIYYAHKNKKMGIDLKTLLSEIPPE